LQIEEKLSVDKCDADIERGTAGIGALSKPVVNFIILYLSG
jgi:hypothetical protein